MAAPGKPPPPAVSRRRAGRPTAGQDLRETLLRVTLRLLERTEDPATVTIARIVREAGCTPPSLYHYWGTREELLRDASARGWEAFRGSQQASAREDEGPLERIRGRGQAYVAFARERPALFRALFVSATLSPPTAERARREPGPEPAPERAPGPALAALVSDVTAAMEAGLLRRTDPTVVALALWASVHGLATLCVTHPELPGALVDDAARLQQDAILAGLAGPRGLQGRVTDRR